jgi:hypothetical protein
MSKPADPYSRVSWRVLDDPKFDGIRGNPRHLGSWLLMLLVADMAYPAPAFVPPTVPKASLAALVTAGLVDRLSDGMYRVHGLDAERKRRSEAAAASASVRYANAVRPQSERSATGLLDETRREEKRLDETSIAGGRAQEPRPPRGGPMVRFEDAMTAAGYKKP